MEQIEGPMNIVASSSVHVNSYGGGGGGQGLPPPRRGKWFLCVSLKGIYDDGTNLCKITQTFIITH